MTIAEPVAICLVCGSAALDRVSLDWPFFRQTDFTTMTQGAVLAECARCGAMFRIANDVTEAEIAAQFAEEAYADSHQSGQRVFADGYREPVTRGLLQAAMVAPLLGDRPAAVLDIGCYDGTLLREIGLRLPDAALHGFDTTEHLRRVFPTDPRFRFWSPRLDAVSGTFDLICLSHTLMYVKDLARLMCDVDRLLAPAGAVFFQMPDVAHGPCLMLMGDQYHYFTAASLARLLASFGFRFEPVVQPWFPREIVGVARLGADPAALGAAPMSPTVRHVAGVLDTMARGLRALVTDRPVVVLGVTAPAAFVDSVIGDTVAGVVDESPHRQGAMFRGKPVRHPREVAPDTMVIIPYGPSGRRIAERFERDYRCQTRVV